jgi:hypothetical protein
MLSIQKSPRLHFRQVLGCAFLMAVAMVFYEIGRSSSLLSTVCTEASASSLSVDPSIGEGVFQKKDISAASINTTTTTSTAPQLSFTSVLDRWQTTTAMVTISFGKATETKLLERLVYSLRTNGQWNGPLVVLTDHAEYYHQRFAELFAGHPSYHQHNLIILPAKPEHLHPVDAKTGKPIPFINDAMRFKRFKTLVFDYLDEHYQYQFSPPLTTLNQHQHAPPPPYQNVLYLDVEIVVARPIISLLQDYQDQMIQREVFLLNSSSSNGSDASSSMAAYSVNATVPPFMSLFSDCAKCGRQNFNLNGGVLLLHYEKSRPCLQEWQSLFAQGADYSKADQRYLVVMKKTQQQQQNQCKMWQLPDYHRLYPTRKEMRLKRSSTIVHNTNTYQATRIPYHVQQAYFAYLVGTNSSYFTAEELEIF